jgi:hypothetical protein
MPTRASATPTPLSAGIVLAMSEMMRAGDQPLAPWLLVIAEPRQWIAKPPVECGRTSHDGELMTDEGTSAELIGSV